MRKPKRGCATGRSPFLTGEQQRTTDMLGTMKGWNFSPKLSADGTTSLETLRAEKARLEKRLAEIPGLITRLQNSINTLSSDIKWLSELSDRRARNWEEENGKSVKQAIYDGNIALAGMRGDMENLNAEKSRIPGQIAEIDKQIGILIQGESTGLSKGIDRATAQQIGQLELERTKNIVATEQATQQIQLQQAQQAADAAATQTPGMSSTLKWGLIIGVSVLVVIGVLYYIKQNKAMPVAAAIPNNPIQL